MRKLELTRVLTLAALPLFSAVAAAEPARICIATPQANMAQGANGTDAASAMKATLISYLSGPATEIVPLESRIPIQMQAEAEQLGCPYILTTQVVHTKGGKGLGGLMTAGSMIASAMPYGGMGGGDMAAYQAAAVAQSAMQGAAMAQQEEALAAMYGVAQNNIKKGDKVKLVYKLSQADGATVAEETLERKATQAGEDVLSPMIEQAATVVVTKAVGGG